MSRLSNAALTAALLEIKPLTWHLCAENERRVRSAPACGLLETPAIINQANHPTSSHIKEHYVFSDLSIGASSSCGRPSKRPTRSSHLRMVFSWLKIGEGLVGLPHYIDGV